MCTGSGGGGAQAATITDPLQKTGAYRKAKARVENIKDRKGQMDPDAYKRKLQNAKQKLDKAPKYKDNKANKVEDATDFMWDKVKDLLDPSNPLNVAQDLLNASTMGLQQTMQGVNDLATAAANNQQLLQQDAMRMSMLIGPPPPEKTANAPVIGSNRDEEMSSPRSRGRRSLRIDRTSDSTLAI
jgi:hypothetical protein